MQFAMRRQLSSTHFLPLAPKVSVLAFTTMGAGLTWNPPQMVSVFTA